MIQLFLLIKDRAHRDHDDGFPLQLGEREASRILPARNRRPYKQIVTSKSFGMRLKRSGSKDNRDIPRTGEYVKRLVETDRIPLT